MRLPTRNRHLAAFLFVLIPAASLATLAAAPPNALAADCVSANMTVTATVSSDPGFVGMWKYCISGSWDVGASPALSHINFYVGLLACECVCDPRVIAFGPSAGTSVGVPDACKVNYTGEYLCMGDPSIPAELRTPAVKFEYPDGQGCEPSTSGSGTWCFYSPLPPAPATTYPDGIVIKYGSTGTCTGDLTGQLPSCDCATGARRSTWGSLKILYR
jgi:hypothetical protein